jgi:predicted nucleic acid-binding protein
VICADTSSMARYLDGAAGRDVDLVAEAVHAGLLVLAPPTITELLSYSIERPMLTPLLRNAVVLPLATGFWERAGLTQRGVRQQGLKAKLADTLIAQCCIDAGAVLIAHDTDFRHFVPLGLKLAA